MVFPKRVVLVQRAVSHFRVPVLNELAKNNPGCWLLLTGKIAKNSNAISGLDGTEEVEMDMDFLNVRCFGDYTWITGFKLIRRNVDLLVLEGTLSILSNIPLLVWCRIHSIPVVIWTKGMRQNRRKRRGLNRLYEKMVFFLASRFIVYGQLSVEDLIEKGVSRHKIFVAQNSIDTDKILQSQNEYRAASEGLAGSECLTFGYMGRLCLDKDVAFIVEAFALYRQKMPSHHNSRLLIAGEGPDRESLMSLVDGKNLKDHVHFMGAIPVGEEAVFFDQTDIYVSVKSHGLGIVEAMAYGKAILITPEEGPEAENVVNNNTGIISADGTLMEFVKSMCLLADSPESRHRLGGQAIKHVRQTLGIKNMVKGIEAAVESLC